MTGFLRSTRRALDCIHKHQHTQIMKTKTLFALAAGITGLAADATAATIISDTFNAANGTSMIGRAPNTTNLPGGTWYTPNGGWSRQDIQDGALRLDSDNRAGISLQSTISYTQPTSFFISADLKIGSLVNDTEYPRGIWMGFGNSANSSDSNISGLVLSPSGRLSLVLAGQVISSVNYTGIWNPGAFHNLSFKVDSVANTLGDIALAGSSADYRSLSSAVFNANPNFAFVRVSDSPGGNSGYIDNLVIADEPISSTSAVPEASTSLGLLALGAGGVLTRRRFKRKA